MKTKTKYIVSLTGGTTAGMICALLVHYLCIVISY